jgi:hypothetical protein
MDQQHARLFFRDRRKNVNLNLTNRRGDSACFCRSLVEPGTGDELFMIWRTVPRQCRLAKPIESLRALNLTRSLLELATRANAEKPTRARAKNRKLAHEVG